MEASLIFNPANKTAPLAAEMRTMGVRFDDRPGAKGIEEVMEISVIAAFSH
tara:strand:- start:924 stop:1076 length:153 start_codon:yes stop_codon:yes gene_type:complete